MHKKKIETAEATKLLSKILLDLKELENLYYSDR